MTSFSDFGLAEPIRRALAEEDYTVPTPIQAQTIPLALERRDIVGIAQTGTGKTAAFALPIIHALQAEPRRPDRKTCRVLVLSPTRELSGQIETSFRTYGRHLQISTALAIGGVPMGRQVRSLLNGVDVLVATPGRLLDLVKENALKLSSVEVLVLDEADRMLDMGFIHDIRKIVAKLPKARQTLFFSATMPAPIAELAEQMLRDPARVAVTPVASTAERVSQRIIHVDRQAKPQVLAELLRGEREMDRTLVFTRTKHGADKVVRSLEKAGLGAGAIHGNKSQGQRERVLAAFRSGQLRTLVATDIAARGIDVDGITHVINYDLPNVPETYVHRIGRTARAGADGVAISLVDHEERAYVRDIERLIRMAIPLGENRSSAHAAPRPASGASDRRNGDGRHDGKPRHAREQRRDGQRPDHAHRHERQDRPARQERQARPERQDRPARGARPERAARPERQRQDDQRQKPPQHHGGQRSGARPHPQNDGGIAAVAFMQRRPRPQASDRSPR